MPSDIAKHPETVADTGVFSDKIEPTTASLRELPIPGKEHLHVVLRKEEIPDDDESVESIPGYDAHLMRARATLSNEEEKKLLRRIDWRLIPLLAVMYMVKTIDAANVCLFCVWGVIKCSWPLSSRMPGLWPKEPLKIF